eukprot:gene39302-34781_t
MRKAVAKAPLAAAWKLRAARYLRKNFDLRVWRRRPFVRMCNKPQWDSVDSWDPPPQSPDLNPAEQ